MAFKRSKVATKATDVVKSVLGNQIYYLKSVSSVFKHYAIKKHGYSQEDRTVINETITQLDYTVVLLKRLKETYGDDVPDQYRFNGEMSEIYRLTNEMDSETFIDGLISITMVGKVNKITESVIEKYHNVDINVPFWKRLFN